jgi:hypothetical protein
VDALIDSANLRKVVWHSPSLWFRRKHSVGRNRAMDWTIILLTSMAGSQLCLLVAGNRMGIDFVKEK